MAPDPNLNRLDFSKSVSIRRNVVSNFTPTAFTISFWIQWNPRGTGSASSHHSSDGEGSQPRWNDPSSFRLVSYCDMTNTDHPNAIGPRLLVLDPSNITVWFQGASGSTGVGVGDGKWHHLAISVQKAAPSTSAHVTVVRDGMPAGATLINADAGLTLQPGAPLVVTFPFQELMDSDGGSSGKMVEGLGSIAEVRLWNGVRSAKQAAVEMTGYLASHPDLRLHWPIGFGGRGNLQTTVPDASGNHNDGTLMLSTSPGWNATALPWPAAPADLSGVDLSGADITGLPLHGGNLSAAVLGSFAFAGSSPPYPPTNLTGVDLSGANLTGADLRAATKLNGTNFTGAVLHGCNFSGTDLTPATFSAQPDWSRDAKNRTILDGATVSTTILGKDWSFLHLTGANVNGLDGDLSNIKADNMIFQMAPMTGCRLQGSSFIDADLTNAQLNGADLTKCKLIGTTLFGANMSGATLTYADLTGALLGGAGNTVNSAVLSYAFMPGATLTNVEAYGVNFSYAQIYAGAKIDGAHLENADLSNANLCDMDFTQAHMKSVTLDHAYLVRCKFNGVDLSASLGRGSSFTKARLQGADFSAAILDGADLAGAAVALAPGSISVTRISMEGYTVTANEGYDVTLFDKGAGDQFTTWPNETAGKLSHPSTQLVAKDPPPPPTCIPSLTDWCTPSDSS
jgi:uncharacterized protein YjbI with pentapeptide repeats